MWEKPQAVCKPCFNKLSKQEALLKKIRRLADQQKIEKYKTSENKNYELLLAVQHVQYSNHYCNTNSGKLAQQLQQITTITTATENGLSLAEYPTAGVLISIVSRMNRFYFCYQSDLLTYFLSFLNYSSYYYVYQPTKPESPPIESVLFPIDLVPLDTYWSAPAQNSSVEITIVLSYKSAVHKLCLFVDSLGYESEYDLPTVQIFAGNTMHDLKSYGNWTLSPDGIANYI